MIMAPSASVATIARIVTVAVLDDCDDDEDDDDEDVAGFNFRCVMSMISWSPENQNETILTTFITLYILQKITNDFPEQNESFRSENCRKFVPANRRPYNWKMYSSWL